MKGVDSERVKVLSKVVVPAGIVGSDILQAGLEFAVCMRMVLSF